jgi:group I intron endonuclease
MINGKRYIGSSENLKRRFREYFNTNYLMRKKCMYICRALLKHGYQNGFYLSILEYCEPGKCLEREDYYLKLENPEYNTSVNPSAPFSGLTHTDKTRQIMSDAKKGENHPMFGQNHSDETRKQISDSKIGQARPAGSGSPSQAIEVTDVKNNNKTSYNSISEAAIALNIQQSRISLYFKNNQVKPYKGQYTFKKL